jgi:hypothetical protein
LFGLDDLINQNYQQYTTSVYIDIYRHRVASQIAAITYPAQTPAYHLFPTIPNFLPRNNAPMTSSNSLTTFTDAIMQSLPSESSPHLLEVEAFLRDPMLPHHYTVYEGWPNDIFQQRKAGKKIKEVAAELQVSASCYRLRCLIG